MQSEEQRLIDGLFSRLKEAEAHSASRDAGGPLLSGANHSYPGSGD